MTLKLMTGIVLALSWTVMADPQSDAVAENIKTSVKSNWRAIAKGSDRVVELLNERRELPDKSFWFWETDKNDQDQKIKAHLGKVRDLLLSTSARKIMADVDAIDRDIAEVAREIRETREDRQLNPDERKKYDERLEKLDAKKSRLETRRRERAKIVCAELRALGLNVSGEAAENCLFPVNFGDLIDGVVVARNIAVVVANLRELMANGDVDAARRYFGMYLVMVDVQVDCFASYLEKSRHGEWRSGINRIRREAVEARDNARTHAKDADFSSAQRDVFARNVKVNAATISATDAYLKILDAHEVVIDAKLTAARKVRKVVANSYETVNLAGDFVRLAKANQDAFDSLLQLDLPPIATFNDAVVQQEFLAITKKLKE